MKPLKFLSACIALCGFSSFAQTQPQQQSQYHDETLPILCGFSPSRLQELAAKDQFKARKVVLKTKLGPALAEIFISPKGEVVLTIFAKEDDECLIGVGSFQDIANDGK